MARMGYCSFSMLGWKHCCKNTYTRFVYSGSTLAAKITTLFPVKALTYWLNTKYCTANFSRSVNMYSRELFGQTSKYLTEITCVSVNQASNQTDNVRSEIKILSEDLDQTRVQEFHLIPLNGTVHEHTSSVKATSLLTDKAVTSAASDVAWVNRCQRRLPVSFVANFYTKNNSKTHNYATLHSNMYVVFIVWRKSQSVLTHHTSLSKNLRYYLIPNHKYWKIILAQLSSDRDNRERISLRLFILYTPDSSTNSHTVCCMWCTLVMPPS